MPAVKQYKLLIIGLLALCLAPPVLASGDSGALESDHTVYSGPASIIKYNHIGDIDTSGFRPTDLVLVDYLRIFDYDYVSGHIIEEPEAEVLPPIRKFFAQLNEKGIKYLILHRHGEPYVSMEFKKKDIPLCLLADDEAEDGNENFLKGTCDVSGRLGDFAEILSLLKGAAEDHFHLKFSQIQLIHAPYPDAFRELIGRPFDFPLCVYFKQLRENLWLRLTAFNLAGEEHLKWLVEGDVRAIAQRLGDNPGLLVDTVYRPFPDEDGVSMQDALKDLGKERALVLAFGPERQTKHPFSNFIAQLSSTEDEIENYEEKYQGDWMLVQLLNELWPLYNEGNRSLWPQMAQACESLVTSETCPDEAIAIVRFLLRRAEQNRLQPVLEAGSAEAVINTSFTSAIESVKPELQAFLLEHLLLCKEMQSEELFQVAEFLSQQTDEKQELVLLGLREFHERGQSFDQLSSATASGCMQYLRLICGDNCRADNLSDALAINHGIVNSLSADGHRDSPIALVEELLHLNPVQMEQVEFWLHDLKQCKEIYDISICRTLQFLNESLMVFRTCKDLHEIHALRDVVRVVFDTLNKPQVRHVSIAHFEQILVALGKLNWEEKNQLEAILRMYNRRSDDNDSFQMSDLTILIDDSRSLTPQQWERVWECLEKGPPTIRTLDGRYEWHFNLSFILRVLSDAKRR